MTRITAAAIDFAITIFIPLAILAFADMTIGVLFVIISIVNFIYFFAADYFRGGYTTGKRWMDMYISLRKSPKYGVLPACLIHSAVRAAISVCWPLGLLIFVVFNYKMPYDKAIYDKLINRS